MPIQKLILLCIVFGSALLVSVLAADKPATHADVEKLQEQVRTLDKELSVQREAFVRKLDDVEKRQTEITAQQANSLATVSNQTATLGNYIALTSAAITIIVFIAGFATYFSAKSKAEQEAREASHKWFDQNAIDLRKQIETLRTEAEKATNQIQSQAKQFEVTATTLHKDMSDAATAVLNVAKTQTAGEGVKQADPQSVKVISEANQTLKSKPELDFTASDFFTRGLSHFSNQEFHAALSAFESALRLAEMNPIPKQLAQYLVAKAVTLGQLDKPQDEVVVYDELDKRFATYNSPAVRELVAKGLFNKGVALRHLDKPQDAIAAYSELDKRFGGDTSPALREQVASGLNGSGFHRILFAKQKWHDTTIKNELLSLAISGLQRALKECGDDERALVLGNLGYSLFLVGQLAAAEQTTLECLKLGGREALKIQRKDATMHRVEPEDTEYEALLYRLWQSLQPQAMAS